MSVYEKGREKTAPSTPLETQNKEPRPQGGALKPQSFRTKHEIPKHVRDDKKESQAGCHAELVSASG